MINPIFKLYDIAFNETMNMFTLIDGNNRLALRELDILDSTNLMSLEDVLSTILVNLSFDTITTKGLLYTMFLEHEDTIHMTIEEYVHLRLLLTGD